MTLKRILLVTISLLFSSSALAAHLDLAWNPNSEPDLAGYKIYYGTGSRDYREWIDVGSATSVRITGLLEDTEYFLALTAYDIGDNESDFSGEVSAYTVVGDEPILPDDQPADGFIFDLSEKNGCFIGKAIRIF